MCRKPMQNQNEGKVLGKEVLGLDPEIRELVEKRALSYGLSYCWSTYKTKNQVSVPVAESILLTDPFCRKMEVAIPSST